MFMNGYSYGLYTSTMIPFRKAVRRGLPGVGGPVGDVKPALSCQVLAARLSDEDMKTWCQTYGGAQALCQAFCGVQINKLGNCLL